MKIQNIYDSQFGERLYSVLLDENELYLFSETIEEDPEVLRKRRLQRHAAGAGINTAIGASLGHQLLKRRKGMTKYEKALTAAGTVLGGINAAYHTKKALDNRKRK